MIQDRNRSVECLWRRDLCDDKAPRGRVGWVLGVIGEVGRFGDCRQRERVEMKEMRLAHTHTNTLCRRMHRAALKAGGARRGERERENKQVGE